MVSYLDGFRTYLDEQDYAENTVRGYCSSVKAFLEWHRQTTGVKDDLSRISNMETKEFREYMSRVKRAKAKTINTKLSSLQCFFGWAATQNLIEENPASRIKMVREAEPGPHYLTHSQQKALYRAMDMELKYADLRYDKRKITRRRDVSLMTFLLNTGLRVNELVSLELNDISLTERKGSVLVRNGKGNKQRNIPLNKQARISIKKWLAVRPETDLKNVWVAVEFKQHSPLGTRSVQHVVKRIGQKADIPDLTPHMLRHTFAKNLLDNGQNLVVVATLLGHANVNTTRLYVVPNRQDLEESVKTLNLSLESEDGAEE
jgi:site-specific recombinase XerD